MAETPGAKKIKVEAPVAGEGTSDHPEMDPAILLLDRVSAVLDDLTSKENQEILVIEEKYIKLRQEHYQRRGELAANVKDFWYTVFTSHPGICHILTNEEEDVLKYLKNVEVVYAETVKAGYKIKLHFKENPYFKNEVLVKEYGIEDGKMSSTNTTIDWIKPLRGSIPKSGRKRAGTTKTFFEWFADKSLGANDEISEVIKDDLWPNALHFYLVPDQQSGASADSTTTDSDE